MLSGESLENESGYCCSRKTCFRPLALTDSEEQLYLASSSEVGRAVCLGEVHRKRVGLALGRAQLLDQRGVCLPKTGGRKEEGGGRGGEGREKTTQRSQQTQQMVLPEIRKAMQQRILCHA